MSLQLYQVDYKSFLLDFKSLPKVDGSEDGKDTDPGNWYFIDIFVQI
jgi:hypothetical protein